jgi:hypothetical protein
VSGESGACRTTTNVPCTCIYPLLYVVFISAAVAQFTQLIYKDRAVFSLVWRSYFFFSPRLFRDPRALATRMVVQNSIKKIHEQKNQKKGKEKEK